MPVSVLIAVSAIFFSAAEPRPVGSYKVDLSRAPRESRGVLQAVFGNAILRVSPDGKFSFCGIRQSGFWRMHRGRLVMVYEGFMGTPFAIPDEVLKKTWPDKPAFGIVLSFRDPNRLELARFGQVSGPIAFVRQPSRETRTLISESHRDEMDALAEEAYMQLVDEFPARWREVKAAIDDPKFAPGLRTWAAQIWHGPPSEEVALAMLDLVENLDSKGLTEKQARTTRRVIGRNLARIATKPMLARMLSLESKDHFARNLLAEAIVRTKSYDAKPILVEWLKSKSAYDRGAAAEALAQLGARDCLSSVRPIANDEEARARIGALSAIAQLSDDVAEQNSAVDKLALELSGEWLSACDAAEGLGATKLRQAVKPLVNALVSHENAFVRRDAAVQLGLLGFPEAVPALQSAKNGSPTRHVEALSPEFRSQSNLAEIEKIIGRSIEDAPVRKAAAEALWLFDKRRR